MPYYTWHCLMCQHELEVYKTVDERNNPIPCPKCGAEMGRVPGAPGFVLKGQGWPTPPGAEWQCRTKAPRSLGACVAVPSYGPAPR
jgi:putative FmdB family regulatory protein